jgi:hypothetical protein
VSPALVLLRRERHVNKRPPLWPLRFSDERHVRLMRETVALARIARNARADHVFPNRGSTAIARQNVIEIQLAAIENLAAILTGILVALENIVPRKFYFFLRQTIEKQKHNHARHSDLPGNGFDHFVFRRRFGKIEPAIEIVRQKIIFRIGRNDLGMSRINKREGAARGADVHRLPQAIENQNLTIK